MKKYSLIIPTILLVVLFIKLLSNYAERFDEAEKNSANLVKGTSYNDLSDVLYNHNYIANKDDADFVSKFIIQKLEDGQSLPTLYDLNKRIWQIPESLIDSIGSSGYKNKADNSKESIGIDDEFRGVDTSQLQSSTKVNSNQCGLISVSVNEKNEKIGLFPSSSEKACANVVLRLSEQYIDSLDNCKYKIRSAI